MEPRRVLISEVAAVEVFIGIASLKMLMADDNRLQYLY